MRASTLLWLLVGVGVCLLSMADAASGSGSSSFGSMDSSSSQDAASLSDFDVCFCMTSDTTWCYEDHTSVYLHVDGSLSVAGFDVSWLLTRPSCQRFFINHFVWIVPVVLAAVVTLVFPFFFIAARLCCNCCGGRRPSYGCCCPQDYQVTAGGVAIVALDRPYSPRSIKVLWLLQWIFFCGVLCTGIMISIKNVPLHDHIQEALTIVKDVTTQLTDSSGIMTSAAFSLAANSASFIDADSIYASLQASTFSFGNTLSNVESLRHTAHVAENSALYGRFFMVYKIVIVGAVTLIAASIFGSCLKWRFPVAACMCLFCFCTCGYLVMLVVHVGGAVALNPVCKHLDGVVNTTLTNLAVTNGFCADPTVSSSIAAGAKQYFSDACSNGVKAMCGPEGQFGCPADAYRMLCTDAGRRWLDAGAFVTLNNELNNIFDQSTVSDSGCYYSTCTISQCAQQCQSLSNLEAAQQLVSFLSLNQGPMTALLREFEGVYRNCIGIWNELKRSDVQSVVCGSFLHHLQHTVLPWSILACAAFPTLIILFVGIKRFERYGTVLCTARGGAVADHRQDAAGSSSSAAMDVRASSVSLLAGEVDGPLLREVEDIQQLPVATVVAPPRLQGSSNADGAASGSTSGVATGRVVGGYYLIVDPQEAVSPCPTQSYHASLLSTNYAVADNLSSEEAPVAATLQSRPVGYGAV